MLTVAYCRVSTTEQAEEGFSIEGQAEKLRQYAQLHDLGEVVVVADAGLSGKDTNRPGVQQVLAMVEAGHVRHVLVWRLDRLSRDVGDLANLAKTFTAADVTLHSFCEKLDMSSATGRMFFNILASFAQFYREHLGENVRMGMAQAMRQGRWVNRPPTGYDLHDGILRPNDQAATVRRIFRLRAEGNSQREISERTGVNHSTVLSILRNRAYLGEIRHLEAWLPGIHEPLVTEAEFASAHRGRTPGRRQGKDLMSGRVRCGLCGRRMSIEQNGQGQAHYRCKHRGEGCKISARSNQGLLRAAGFGLTLLCDRQIRDAVRLHLGALRRTDAKHARRSAPGAGARLAELRDQRDKLLRLHYDGHITGDQFGQEQARITTEIENLEAETSQAVAAQFEADELTTRFERLIELLDRIQFADLWEATTETERRALLDELLASVTVQPDRLVVEVHGAPPLNVAFSEVGLKAPHSEFAGVGGGTSPDPEWRLRFRCSAEDC